MKTVLILNLQSPKLHKMGDIKPPFQLGYIAGYLKQENIPYEFIDYQIEPFNGQDLKKTINQLDPGFIIFSFATPEVIFAKKIASSIRCSKAIFIATGTHVSFVPQDIITEGSPFDMAFLGEAEQEVVEVIRLLSENPNADVSKIKSLYTIKKKNAQITLVNNLDELPFPIFPQKYNYKNILPIPMAKKVKWGYLYTSRGCPYKCKFCGPIISLPDSAAGA